LIERPLSLCELPGGVPSGLAAVILLADGIGAVVGSAATR
jgi:hypothetical protein